MAGSLKNRFLCVAFVFCLTNVGCNPGQCLRQSDCPLGSTCKQGVCRTPPKNTSAETEPGSSVTDVTNAPQSAEGTLAPTPSDSTSAADDGGASAVSEQSSNVDTTSDTSTTVPP